MLALELHEQATEAKQLVELTKEMQLPDHVKHSQVQENLLTLPRLRKLERARKLAVTSALLSMMELVVLHFCQRKELDQAQLAKS